MYVTSPGKPRRLFNHESDRVFFDRGGRRIRVLKQELSNSTHKPLLQTEQLYTLTQYLHVSADVSTNKARAASSRLSLAAAHWDSFASNSYYGALLGYLPLSGNDGFLPNVLRQWPVTTTASVLDGIPVTAIATSGPGVTLQVWLDPALRYMPRKIHFVRKTTDPLVVSQYTYVVHTTHSLGDYPFPSTAVIEWTKPAGNAPLPKRRVGDNKVSTMSERRIERHVRVLSAELNTDMNGPEFAISTTIPDGIYVGMVDAPHLTYTWSGGTAVPVTDKRALEAVRTSRFGRDRQYYSAYWVRLAMLSLCVGLVASLIGSMVWRYRFR